MSKIRVKVVEEYELEFETTQGGWHIIKEEAEQMWDEKVLLGQQDDYFKDKHISIEVIPNK